MTWSVPLFPCSRYFAKASWMRHLNQQHAGRFAWVWEAVAMGWFRCRSGCRAGSGIRQRGKDGQSIVMQDVNLGSVPTCE